MMLQYLEVKKQYADCLLWFRLGDFYEMFLEDAKIGSRILGIVLTSRARGKDGRIPMAGIPYHAADAYLSKLIKAGYKVAICEQLSEPDGRTLVQREVIRIVTPGTVLDEKSLERKQHNYIVSVYVANQVVGIAATDLSTGDLHANEFSITADRSFDQIIEQVFTQLQPSECIVAANQHQQFKEQKVFKRFPHTAVFAFEGWNEWTIKPAKTIQKYFQSKSATKSVISQLVSAEIATAALLGYLQHTQKMVVTHLHTIQLLLSEKYLKMDRSTMENLELFRPLTERQQVGSLLDVIDHTRTAMGGRLLRQWLLQPLIDKNAIEKRLATVSFFLTQTHARASLIDFLSELNDIERIISRLSAGLGNPKDLKSLEHSLELAISIKELLSPQEISGVSLPPLLTELLEKINAELQQLIDQLHSTIVADPPFDPKQGYLIQPGINTELDALRSVIEKSRDWIAELEIKEKERSGISSLKIKFNQVFGFYIEISNSNLHLAPADYTRKQTLVNAERFITPELKKHEEVILQAEEKMNQIEYHLFMELVQNVLSQVKIIQAVAASLAEIDCLANLGELAENQKYTQPKISEDGEIELHGSRHPVVEQLVETHRFVPNDVMLNSRDQQLLLLTGPNMAGKSVLMRQVALIVLMAHIGSFVPAKSAKISLTDQIFVRSGAADMISAGLSTFMVEMVETAYILRHATADSLIVMDEIGRGTSTYDGISIAWAVAEQIVNCDERGPKTLFATHYHELQALAEECPQKIHNYHMAIAEHEQKPVFLYQLQKGGASHSFGIAVAELAGVPDSVILRAKTLLGELEHRHQSVSSIDAELKQLSVEQLTPIEALNVLARLKKKVDA